MMIYTDACAEVHEGDTVRYVRWNWSARTADNRFYGKAGTVVDVRKDRPDAVGVHFPHHAKGANVLAVASDLRMVACPHEDRRYSPDHVATGEALQLNQLYDLDIKRYGRVAAWNRAALGLPELKEGEQG